MNNESFYTTEDLRVENTAIPYIGSNVNESFNNLDGDPGDYSNLFGLGKKAQANRKIKTQGKADKRKGVADAKKLEAEAKIAAAKATETTGVASAKAVETQALAQLEAEKVAASTKMSTPVKIGIGVGIMLAIGVGAWLFTRRKKK